MHYIKYIDWCLPIYTQVINENLPAVYIQHDQGPDYNALLSYLRNALNDNNLYYELLSELRYRSVLIFFDTEEERDSFFDIFMYSILYGAMYACTYDQFGNVITENT